MALLDFIYFVFCNSITITITILLYLISYISSFVIIESQIYMAMYPSILDTLLSEEGGDQKGLKFDCHAQRMWCNSLRAQQHDSIAPQQSSPPCYPICYLPTGILWLQCRIPTPLMCACHSCLLCIAPSQGLPLVAHYWIMSAWLVLVDTPDLRRGRPQPQVAPEALQSFPGVWIRSTMWCQTFCMSHVRGPYSQTINPSGTMTAWYFNPCFIFHPVYNAPWP